MGKPEFVLEACDRALSLDPASTPALRGKAAALTALGKRDQALVALKSVGSHTPETLLLAARVTVVETLAQPAARRPWSEVSAVLDQADRANPGNVEIAILRAEVWLARNQPDRAREILKKAADSHPDQVEPWLALATLTSRQPTRGPDAGGKPEAALKVLDQARAKLGDRVELLVARTRFLAVSSGNSARSGLAELVAGLDRVSGKDQPSLLNAVAAAYQSIGETERAKQLWVQLAKQEPRDVEVRLVLFELAADRDDDKAMKELISQLRDIEGENSAAWRFAEANRLVRSARQSSDATGIDKKQASTALGTAHELLGEAAQRRPAWPAVAVLEAEIALLENDPSKAIEQYRKATKLGDRRTEVVRALVQLLYQSGRLDEANDVVRDLRPETPLPA